MERQHSNQIHSQRVVLPIPQKYTFLDPSKTTRVPNPALKAFQKNAVQSYFERQQLSAKDVIIRQGVTRPQSLPLTSTTTTTDTTKIHSRSSLPNNFSMQQSSNSTPTTTPTSITSPRISPTLPPVTLTGTVVSPSVSAHSPVQLPLKQSPVLKQLTPSAVTPVHSSSPPHTPPSTTNKVVLSSPTTNKVLSSPSYQATFHQSVATYSTIPMVSNGLVDQYSSQNSIAQQQQHQHHQILQTNNIGSGSIQHSSSISSKMIMVEDGFLQSANESGVPPPPPRRSRSMMPVRR